MMLGYARSTASEKPDGLANSTLMAMASKESFLPLVI
jgi:hypothetical protein